MEHGFNWERLASYCKEAWNYEHGRKKPTNRPFLRFSIIKKINMKNVFIKNKTKKLKIFFLEQEYTLKGKEDARFVTQSLHKHA